LKSTIKSETGLVPRKRTGKDETKDFQAMILEDKKLRSRAAVLQRQFNLFTSPHNNRVREYLRTKNPSVLMD
jgi:hypothetical protein